MRVVFFFLVHVLRPIGRQLKYTLSLNAKSLADTFGDGCGCSGCETYNSFCCDLLHKPSNLKVVGSEGMPPLHPNQPFPTVSGFELSIPRKHTRTLSVISYYCGDVSGALSCVLGVKLRPDALSGTQMLPRVPKGEIKSTGSTCVSLIHGDQADASRHPLQPLNKPLGV